MTTYKITPKTGKVVGIKITDGDEDAMLITDTGVVIRLKVAEISILGRSTQGVTLMRTNDGGKVVSFELVEPEDDIKDEEIEGEVNREEAEQENPTEE